MLRGWFVDRHFYTHDGNGHGRWATFSRGAQIRLALLSTVLLVLLIGLAGTFAQAWLKSNPLPAPALAALPPVQRASEPSAVVAGENAALRSALEESRQKRADLAAELEALQRRPVVTGPTQAAFDQLQADHAAAVSRAEQAEQAAALAAEAAEVAREEVAARRPIEEAELPDRIRSLELELEMARLPPDVPEEASDASPGGDAVEDSFTPKEEMLTQRVQELEATVAELLAERDRLEERLFEAGAPPTPADRP